MDLEEPLARAGRHVACGANPLLGPVQLSGLAHCRGGAPGGAAWHAPPGGVPALLQPAQPHARSRGAARLRPLRYWRDALQPDCPWRADRQVPAGPGAGPDQPRRARDKRITETEFREESLLIAQQLKHHAEARGISLAQFATAWVLAHGAVSSVIAGPRTLQQWQDYLPALDYVVSAEDEALVDGLVRPGHPSTPGYTDPAYPLAGRMR